MHSNEDRKELGNKKHWEWYWAEFALAQLLPAVLTKPRVPLGSQNMLRSRLCLPWKADVWAPPSGVFLAYTPSGLRNVGLGEQIRRSPCAGFPLSPLSSPFIKLDATPAHLPAKSCRTREGSEMAKGEKRGPPLMHRERRRESEGEKICAPLPAYDATWSRLIARRSHCGAGCVDIGFEGREAP
jgi:hypothetical protein